MTTTSYLFKMFDEKEAKMINKARSQSFITVAKFLFVVKRERPDILLAISFLMTRVKTPIEDVWKKLIC
jgi:hypothetical protein